MGAAERRVGVETERLVAAYLRSRGLAGVERTVATGYRTGDRSRADQGDLLGIPGVCVQVKSLRDRRAGRDPNAPAELAVPAWLAETELQRQAAGATIGVLVVRRWGASDVGRWWSFLYARDLFGMADGFSHQLLPAIAAVPAVSLAPVRLELSDLVDMMQAWGWAPAEQGTR